ncbi:acyl-CoA N-acyltransferase [Ilyonectria destructans]|nr:acyl-CoA N-acyltransferase [Ilyonectria destructans]
MAYDFRPATLADAAGIARLGASVSEKTFGHAVPSHDLEEYLGSTYTPSAISAEIENSERNIFVAVDQEGNVRGFSTLALQTIKPCVEAIEGTVELQRMYVDTNTHGRGVGWGLLRCIEKAAMRYGYRSIWLSSYSKNKPTRNAYERWGFQYVGDDYFTMGKTVHHDIIMLKPLEA